MFNPFKLFRQQAYYGRGTFHAHYLLFVRGVNVWYTGKVRYNKFTGRKIPEVSYTISSRGRTGAADRAKLMRRKR